MDEAGRGCLAGPVVGAVVVISSDEQYLPGVWDSKVMSRERREELYDRIVEAVDGFGIGVAGVEEIDELGLSEAGRLCMSRASREQVADKELQSHQRVLQLPSRMGRHQPQSPEDVAGPEVEGEPGLLDVIFLLVPGKLTRDHVRPVGIA